MNLKLTVVAGLLIASVFPAFSLYTGLNEGVGLPEEEMAMKAALSFVREGPTYSFDGIAGTLTVIGIDVLESLPVQYVISISFDSRHAGYGDRTGQVLAQVITHHTAVVKIVNRKVVSAVLDGKWDELNQREISSGDGKPSNIVLSPESASDVAIRYVLPIQDEDGFAWKGSVSYAGSVTEISFRLLN